MVIIPFLAAHLVSFAIACSIGWGLWRLVERT